MAILGLYYTEAFRHGNDFVDHFVGHAVLFLASFDVMSLFNNVPVDH